MTTIPIKVDRMVNNRPAAETAVMSPYPNHNIKENNGKDYIQLNKKTLIAAGFIIVVVFLCLLLTMASGLTQDAQNNHATDTNEADQYQITLTGRFVVGVDEELPPGIYNITATPEEHYFSLDVRRGDEEDLHDYMYEEQVTGYKLRSGSIVDTGSEGAVFTKIADIKESSTQSNDELQTTEDNKDDETTQ